MGVKDEKELLKIYQKFKGKTEISIFSEPDINNQFTSLCLYGDSSIRKKLSHLPLLGKKKMSLSDVHIKMMDTEQTKGQSVLEHGISVSKYYKKLISDIKNDKRDDFIPDCLFDYKDLILENIFDDSIMQKYHLYHDIGKPFVIQIDDDGKSHFPNHSDYSSNLYKILFVEDEDVDIVSKLIKHDMDFHLLKPSQVEEYLKNTDLDKRFIISLLITNLAELHSNSNMFGGFDSVSFKIKFKNYLKISKKILSLI